MPGWKDFRKNKQVMAYIKAVEKAIISGGSLENAKYTQIASLLWVFALLPDTLKTHP